MGRRLVPFVPVLALAVGAGVASMLAFAFAIDFVSADLGSTNPPAVPSSVLAVLVVAVAVTAVLPRARTG